MICTKRDGYMRRLIMEHLMISWIERFPMASESMAITIGQTYKTLGQDYQIIAKIMMLFLPR